MRTPYRSELLRILDEGFRDAARRAGERLACAPGCDACCRQPFPITRLDRALLAEGLEALDRRDPSAAEAIRRRAASARRAFRPGFPGDPVGGRLVGDAAALDRYFAGHAGRVCPVLDPASGRCELYDHRPIACRTYGPPLRFGDRNAPPCTLCFRGAPAAEVERCRWEPDPDDLERRALDALRVPPEEDWHTLIAWAVV